MATVAIITIELRDDHTIGVNGTIDNKLQSLGMLEVAKEAILKHHDAKVQSRILDVPPAGLMGALDAAARQIKP